MSKNVLIVAVVVAAAAWLLSKGRRGAAAPAAPRYREDPSIVARLIAGKDDWTLWVGATGQLWWVYKDDAPWAQQASLRPATLQESTIPGTYLRWTPQDL